MEVRVASSDMNKKSLATIINNNIGENGILKIIPDEDFQNTMESSWIEFRDSDCLPPGASRYYQLSRIADSVFCTEEISKENYPSMQSFLPRPNFDMAEYFSKQLLFERSSGISRSWYKTMFSASYTNHLQEIGVQIPSGWNMNDLQSPLKYSSSILYESAFSMTPFSVEQADMPQLFLMLPGSSQKVFLTFNRNDQIVINDIIRSNKEHVCISPLCHNKYLIEYEQLIGRNIVPTITYQNPFEFVAIDTGICFASASIGSCYSEVVNLYRNRCLPVQTQRYKCDCIERKNLKDPQNNSVEEFATTLEYDMMAATRGNLKIPVHVKHWNIEKWSLARQNEASKKLTVEEVFGNIDENDDSSVSGASSTSKGSSKKKKLDLNVFVRPQQGKAGQRISTIKANANDAFFNVLDNMKEIVSGERISTQQPTYLSQKEEEAQEGNGEVQATANDHQQSANDGSSELKICETVQDSQILQTESESPANTASKFPRDAIQETELKASSQLSEHQSYAAQDNQRTTSPSESQLKNNAPAAMESTTENPSQTVETQQKSNDPAQQASSNPAQQASSNPAQQASSNQYDFQRALNSSITASRKKRGNESATINENNNENQVIEDSGTPPRKRSKNFQSSTVASEEASEKAGPTSQQEEIVKTLKHNKSSKKWFAKLDENRRIARRANDKERKRECNDPVALFFKRNLQNVRDRIQTVEMHLDHYLEHGVLKPGARRNLHELYADRQKFDAEEEDLELQRELVNILRNIYCKARNSLRQCISFGYSGAEIIRCFFTRNDETNCEIYKLAVENTTMSDEKKAFYIELIKNESDWNDFFGVTYGYRIPWKEWIESFDVSYKGLQVYDTLASKKLLSSDAEDSENECEEPNTREYVDVDLPDDLQSMQSKKSSTQKSSTSKKKRKTKPKKKKQKNSQLQFSQFNIAESSDDDSSTSSSSNESSSDSSKSDATMKKAPIKKSSKLLDSEEEEEAPKMETDLALAQIEDTPVDIIVISDDDDVDNADKQNRTQPISKEIVSRSLAPLDYITETFNIYDFDISAKVFTDLTEVGRLPIRKRELYRLAPGEKLSNFLIDEYYGLIQKRSRKLKLKCFVIRTNAAEDTNQMYEKYRKWIHNDITYVFAPLRSNDHFVLFIMNFATKSWFVYDALAGSQFRHIRAVDAMITNVKSLIHLLWLLYNKTVLNFNEWEEHPPDWFDGPIQMNGYDCGMCVCATGEQMSRGEKVIEVIDSDLVRKLMASELLNGELYFQELAEVENSYPVGPVQIPVNSSLNNENDVPQPDLSFETPETPAKEITSPSNSDNNFVADPDDTTEFAKTLDTQAIKKFCKDTLKNWTFEGDKNAQSQSQRRKPMKCGKNKIARSEILSLRSPNTITPQTVQMYFELISQRSNGKCLLAEAWWAKERKYCNREGYSPKKGSIPTYFNGVKYLFAAFCPNPHDNHFVLFVMDIPDRSFFFYDPYGNEGSDAQLKNANATLKAIDNLKNNIIDKTIKECGHDFCWSDWRQHKPEGIVFPKTKNFALSGVLVSQMAEQFSRGILNIKMDDIALRRELMLAELLNGELYFESD